MLFSLTSTTIPVFYHPFIADPLDLQRKPQSQHNAPYKEYLGHNPIIAMAQLCTQAKNVTCDSKALLLKDTRS